MPIPELITLATAILAWSAVSRPLATAPLTPTLLFMVCGLIVGPDGLGWAGFGLGDDALRQLAELTLLLVLFSDAARIDFRRLRRDSRAALRLLLVGLPLAIVFGTLLARLLFPEWSWVQAALLAAILAPTDPALAQAIVVERRIPIGVRQPINVESGLNDGICLPIVLLLVWLASSDPGNGAPTLARWFLDEIILGPATGVLIAWAGGRLVESAVHAGRITPDFRRLATLAVVLLAFGCAEAVGGNGLLAAFAAGATISRSAPDLRRTIHTFGATEGEFLSLLTFLVFGATAVIAAFPGADVTVFVYAALSLVLVRPLAVAIAFVGSGFRWRSVVMFGWFGPRGLASVLFTFLAVQATDAVPPGLAQTAIITVALSVLAHGVTSGPLARAYARHATREAGYHREHRATGHHHTRHHSSMTQDS